MRFVYFANNRLGAHAAAWLAEEGYRPVAVVVHPGPRARHRDEIILATGVPPERVIEAQALGEAQTLTALASLEPELGLSVLFGYLLSQPVLNLFPAGCLNLHPALLPYNRGANPNVWSIIERTPAGATLHYIDGGIDTGDIVAQHRIDVFPTDTGESLYRRLEICSLQLLQEAWPAVVSRQLPRRAQDRADGTYHQTRDLQRLDYIDLDRRYQARELIDLLRARTFPPYRGAYFVLNGRRIYVTVDLREEEPA